MHPASSDNTHHEVTTFEVDRMVSNIKNFKSQFWNMDFS